MSTDLATPTMQIVGQPPAGITGLPFNLLDLQKAALQFGLTPDATLAAATMLYGRGLISYPHVEERLMPLHRFADCSNIVRAYRMASGSRDYDPEFKGAAWAEEMEGPHHGIALTDAPAGALFGVSMSDAERDVYTLVHDRFLSLFRRH
jgi:DNA topoisomerase IA